MKLLLICLLLSATAYSKEVPPLREPLTDLAQIISKEDARAINEKILQYYKSTTNQIAILIVPSLDGEVLEQYSIKVAETWKLGSKKEDNGVLLLFAINDRKMRIEVGQGLEGDLTDLESKAIINSLVPYLKNKQYTKALILEIDSVIKTITKNHVTPAVRQAQVKYREQQREELFAFAKYSALLILAFLFITSLTGYFTNRKKSKEYNQKIAETNLNLETQMVSLEQKKESLKILNSQYKGSKLEQEDNLNKQISLTEAELSKYASQEDYLLRIAKKYGVNV